MEKESSLGDAVGLIVELIGHHLVEVFELPLLKDLGVEPCHTVYGETGADGKVCHPYLSVVDYGHIPDLFLIPGIGGLYLQAETAVDLLDYLINPGKQTGEELYGPLFQSFAHDGVVCISTGAGGNLPGLIPGEIVVIHKDPHKFGDSHGGVGII